MGEKAVHSMGPTLVGFSRAKKFAGQPGRRKFQKLSRGLDRSKGRIP
jgi:hypothetical protein